MCVVLFVVLFFVFFFFCVYVFVVYNTGIILNRTIKVRNGTKWSEVSQLRCRVLDKEARDLGSAF